mmetsp:Transcript_9059/g.13623  ORF Transcript_9059/g.13623 Transcript_9059/m.13623 type:complete len:747 (-) Transcript_9059:277-2517(-)
MSREGKSLCVFLLISAVASFCCLFPYFLGYEVEPLHSYAGYEFAIETSIVAMSVTLPIALDMALDINLPFSVLLPRCVHIFTLVIPNLIIFFRSSSILLVCSAFMRELLLRAALMSHMFHNKEHFTLTYSRLYTTILILFGADTNVRLWCLVTDNVPNVAHRISAAITLLSTVMVLVIVYKVNCLAWREKSLKFLKGSSKYAHYYSLLMVLGMIGKSLAKVLVQGPGVLDSGSDVLVMYGVFNLCDVGMGVVAAVIPSHIARHDLTLSKHIFEIKQGFVRFLSREVRASLGTIHMGLDVARNIGRHVYSGSELERMFSDLMNSCAVADQVLDDMLLISDIEDNKIGCNKTIMRVENLVQHAMEPISFIASKSGITLSYEGEDGVNKNSLTQCVEVDECKIVQVLRNLTSTVVESTPRGGLVNVLVRTLPPASAHCQLGVVRIELHDSGPGMPKKEFQRLQQYSKHNHTPMITRHCSRVDLWMSRIIVELNGGTLDVLPREGPGCTFALDIPIVGTDQSMHHQRDSRIWESSAHVCKNAGKFSNLISENVGVEKLEDVGLDRVLIGCPCGDDNATFLRDTMRSTVNDIVDCYSEAQLLEEVKESINSHEPYDIVFIHRELSPQRAHVLVTRLRKLNFVGVIVLLSDIHYVDTNNRFLVSGGDSVVLWPDCGPPRVNQRDIECVLIDVYNIKHRYFVKPKGGISSRSKASRIAIGPPRSNHQMTPVVSLPDENDSALPQLNVYPFTAV